MKPLSLLVIASFLNLIIIIITVSIGSQIIKSSQEVAPVKGRDGEAERGLITPTRQVIRKKVIVTISPKPNQTSPQKSQTSSPPISTTTPAPDNRCQITVDGIKYDVTSFRQNHSGGDIFSCGTDMSQIFWGQHNAKILSRMQPYKI